MNKFCAKSLILGIVPMLFFALKSNATNYYVNDNSVTNDIYCSAVGAAGNNGLTPAAPKATLTQVLSVYGGVLTSGDIIYVDAGTYYRTESNLNLNYNGISIIGAGMGLTFFDHDGGAPSRWANITGSNITISNLYITGYNYSVGNANVIQVSGATNITFNNVMVNENLPGGGSSSIVVNGGSSVIFNGGGSSCNPGSASVAGGGINVEGNGNTVTITNYTLSANEKDYQGGSALYVIGNNTSSVTVTNSIFSNNINGSGSGGGAIFLADGAILNISGSCFNNNNANQTSSVNYGGAISIGRGSTATISSCSFSGNVAIPSGNGGAISINTGLGSAGTTGTANISNCNFTGNMASSNGADIYGRVSFGRAAVFNIDQCTWSGTARDITNDNTAVITVTNSGNPSTSGSVSVTVAPATSSPTLACPSLAAPCFSVLPVEFLDFSIACEKEIMKLNWSTASERNNDFFTILYSEDYKNWVELHLEDGNGSSQSKSEYSVDLLMARPGYYKLIQTDFDGKNIELKTLFTHDCSAGLNVLSANYNDQQGTILLNYSTDTNEKMLVQFIDNMGKLIFTYDVHFLNSTNRLEIPAPLNLSKGIYFVHVHNDMNSQTLRCFISPD
jgi:hypothetical protein